MATLRSEIKILGDLPPGEAKISTDELLKSMEARSKKVLSHSAWVTSKDVVGNYTRDFKDVNSPGKPTKNCLIQENMGFKSRQTICVPSVLDLMDDEMACNRDRI